MNLSSLIVFSDLSKLPRESLEEINTDLGLPESNIQQEMVKSIGMELNKSPETKQRLANYCDTLFVGGSVSWFKMENGNIGDLKKIVQSRSQNPFNEIVRFNSENLTTDPIIYGAADFSEDSSEFYIRYVYNSGNSLIPTADGNFKTIQKAAFVTVLVIPNLNVVEIRATRTIANKIARKIAGAFPVEDKAVLSKVKIFDDHKGTDEKVKEFIDATEARVSESVDFPVLESGEEEFDQQAVVDLHTILATIDSRGNGGDDGLSIDVNQAIDNSSILEKFNNMPFVAILLNGLGKVNLSSILKDLRDTPLYDVLHPYLQTKFSFVEINFPTDGVDQLYPLQLGKTTNTINVTKQANEEFLKYIRELLVG